MSRRSRKAGAAPRPIDWSQEVARAERDLARNNAQIESTVRGTPGFKPTDWRLGQGPGASRGKAA